MMVKKNIYKNKLNSSINEKKSSECFYDVYLYHVYQSMFFWTTVDELIYLIEMNEVLAI